MLAFYFNAPLPRVPDNVIVFGDSKQAIVCSAGLLCITDGFHTISTSIVRLLYLHLAKWSFINH
jgi:hypothetical protein